MNGDYLSDSVGRRYTRLFLSFTVGVAVALAPFLGAVGVPGFRALFSLLPVDIRDLALALSAIVSGLVALYATTLSSRAERPLLRKWFRRWTWLTAVSVVLFCIALLTMAVPVTIGGGEETVRFSVGPLSRPNRPPCYEQVSDSRCLELITLNPGRVRDMWGDASVSIGQAVTLMSYLGVIGSVGAVVGFALGLRRRSVNRRRSLESGAYGRRGNPDGRAE